MGSKFLALDARDENTLGMTRIAFAAEENDPPKRTDEQNELVPR